MSHHVALPVVRLTTTTCAWCEVEAHWLDVEHPNGCSVVQSAHPAGELHPCEHWREHQEAHMRLVGRGGVRAVAHPVTARWMT